MGATTDDVRSHMMNRGTVAGMADVCFSSMVLWQQLTPPSIGKQRRDLTSKATRMSSTSSKHAAAVAVEKHCDIAEII